MTLEEWLNQIGSLAVAAFAEDMPGGTHGRRKSAMIEWILSDSEARLRATESMRIDARLKKMPHVPVGFVNKAGDAL